ncbi:hypothetical protein RND81_02G222900 [Saponaria officinalis]|uniref:Mucin-like protein n=1 Tax=Saponaria officinalis TaxID=3572 RepID=A0AAW1MXI1_SAPOF
MLLRLAKSSTTFLRRLSTTSHRLSPSLHRHFSTTTNTTDDDNWNDAWETAWLPTDDTTSGNTPWESTDAVPLPTDADADTTAFVADMNDNWDDRRRKLNQNKREINTEDDEPKKVENDGGLYCLENVKRDYRLKKQRIHAALWVKEIEKLEESKLGVNSDTHDIDMLLDSCSEIFDSASNDVNNLKVPSTSEFKNKPDGWESMAKSEDGSLWEMSQREEDILLQEFERRMAFCKFQIASFIKTHIFSRRRPIDGWKYMIEVIGPNAQKGKGSVSRMPSLADPATQAFTQDRQPTAAAAGGGRGRLTSPRRR